MALVAARLSALAGAAVLAAMLAAPAHAAGRTYTPVPLPDLGGGRGEAIDISNSGLVVGTSAVTGDWRTHGVIWQNGMPADLGPTVFPAAVNDTGDVTGSIVDDLEDQHAFVRHNGQLIDLGYLGAAYSRGMDVNAGGTALIWAGDSSYTWHDGVLTRLPNLDPSAKGSSEARYINDRGDVVGFSTGTDAKSHLVEWTGGRIVEINIPNGYPHGLNNHGDVLVSAGTTNYIWRDGQTMTLPAMPGSDATVVAIDDVGDVLGSSRTGASNWTGDVLLWRGGGWADVAVGDGEAINAAGDIVGVRTGTVPPAAHSIATLWH